MSLLIIPVTGAALGLACGILEEHGYPVRWYHAVLASIGATFLLVWTGVV